MKIERAEEDRLFCHHTIEHFLDVARLMTIYCLEDNLPFSKDVIYATALLHDIGRGLQYEEGIPHEEAGVRIAEQILGDCGYEAEEIACILQAIGAHRKKQDDPAEVTLGELLYKADKACRPCYACKARELCNWPVEKQNLQILY